MQEERGGRIERIAIIGVGAVGSTTAYAMIQAGAASELILADLDRRRVEGELMDLQHCLPFTDYMAITVADVEEVAGCDLVIVTAGVAQQQGESRLNLVQRNLAVFESFMPGLAQRNPTAKFLIITNPVDVMTRIAAALTGLPDERVFGTGTVLDTARFRTLLSAHYGILPRHVHAYVIGEHGDSEVLVWSRAMIGPFHISEYGELHQISMTPQDTERIGQDVRQAAERIIERKGATHFAIGLAVVMLTDCLSRNLNAVMTVSRRVDDLYGLSEVCLSLPTLVCRQGAMTQYELPLSGHERDELLKSAEILDRVYRQLGL